jgi:hypothetical protein
MQKLLICSILVFGMACKKSSDSNNTGSQSPQPKFQFTANGTVYTWNAVDVGGVWTNYPTIVKSTGSVNGTAVTSYSFRTNNSSGQQGYSLILGLCSGCSTISSGTYPVGNGKDVDSYFNGVGYSITTANNANTNYTVTISSITNGLANGTFSGVLQPRTAGSGPTLTITNGTFSNIPVQ